MPTLMSSPMMPGPCASSRCGAPPPAAAAAWSGMVGAEVGRCGLPTGGVRSTGGEWRQRRASGTAWGDDNLVVVWEFDKAVGVHLAEHASVQVKLKF